MSGLPRSVWSGSLRLGELVVPVGLAPTRESGEPRFVAVHSCGRPVKRSLGAAECLEHGAVPDEALLRAWDLGAGEFLVVASDELEAVAPRDSRQLQVFAIVDGGTPDQWLVERAWFLVPGRSRVGREAYAAVEHGLREESLAGLVRFTGWGRERLAQLRPADRGVLVLQELAPAADLRDAGGITQATLEVVLDERVAELARQLLRRLEIPFEPALLVSRHRARLEGLLDARLRGSNVLTVEPEEAPAAASGDLAGALEASLRSAPRSRKARREAALSV